MCLISAWPLIFKSVPKQVISTAASKYEKPPESKRRLLCLEARVLNCDPQQGTIWDMRCWGNARRPHTGLLGREGAPCAVSLLLPGRRSPLEAWFLI